MKYALALLILLSPVISHAAHTRGDIIQFEELNGKRYKVIHHLSDAGVIIYYFSDGAAPTGKWNLRGSEVYRDGEKIKDTFKDNDR